MAILRSLRDQLFKYRKHKVSLDGRIPGADISYHRGGQSPAPYGHTGHFDAGHGAPHHFEVYDPTHAQYNWASSEYDPPPPWFDGLKMDPPPSLRLDPVEFEITPHPQSIHYNDSLMTDELLQTVLIENPDSSADEARDPAPPPLPDLPQMQDDRSFIDDQVINEVTTSEPVSQSMDLEGMVNQMFDDQDMAPELPDGFALMETAHEQMAQTLEQIIAQEPMSAAQVEPIPDPWEDPLLKQQQWYDLQMQPLMNPFGLPGPGM